MAWSSRVREAGWFKTGKDGRPGSHVYATAHLFVRLSQDMNDTGEWTLELHDCHRGADGPVAKVYDNKSDARTALRAIYALTRHLDLQVEGAGEPDDGRWEVRSHDPSPQDEAHLARFGRRSSAAASPAS